MTSKESEKTDTGIQELKGEDAAKMILEAEALIEAIKNGEIPGEYFEF